MNEGYLQRLKLCEDRITVARNDTNKALNEVMDVITKMMTANRMFQLYTDTNLKELREKLGLTGELLTDNLTPVETPAVLEKPESGIEL